MSKVKKKEPPDKGANFTKNKSPYRTLKTSLKSIIKDPEIHNKINELVIKCNDIVIDTYMFIRLYSLNQYHKNLQIPIINEDFISYCITTIGEKNKCGRPSTDLPLLQKLKEFYDNEYQPIFNHQKYDLKCLSFTLPYICQTIETCISTNLKEHFIKRLLRFINIFADKFYDKKYNNDIIDEKEYIKVKRDNIWKLKKAIIENKYTEIPDKLKDWFNDNKKFIIPDEFTKSIAYDCQCNPSKYIKYLFYMNQKYEEFNESIKLLIIEKQNNNVSSDEIKKLNCQIIKLFQPLSLRKSNIPKYITLDTATLINIFTEKGKANLLQNLKENQEDVWNNYFRMNSNIFKSSNDYLFNYTLQTDGIGCSLLFKHESIKDKKYGGKIKLVDNSIPYIDDLSEYQFNILRTKKIVTGDPGKFNLMYLMDDDNNKLKYTCCQRDTESLAKRNRRIKLTNKKQDSKIIEYETELSNYLSTTVNYIKFKEFIKNKHDINKKTKKFYEDELYRKINWRTKVYRQKSEDKFLNNIENKFGDKNDIVLVIGDWSNKPGTCIKGASTMCVGLKRLINKKFTTMLIDEYNTSKKCCNCWKDIENITIDGNKKFRLLGCKNCKSCNIGSPEGEHKSIFNSYSFLTRDKNSCINMLNIIKYMIYNKKKRPLEFSRG
jgi:hypothetical protein